MAHLYAPRAAFDWSDDWCDNEDGVQDAGTYPGKADNADQAHFNQNSGNCTVDLSHEFALGALSTNEGTGYVGTMAVGTQTITVDGGITLLGTYTASAGGTITGTGLVAKTTPPGTTISSALKIELTGTTAPVCNGSGGGALSINTAGTITIAEPQLWDSFTGAAGTYAPVAQRQTIAGNIDFQAGITITTGTATWTMSEDGIFTNTGAETSYIFEIASDKEATVTHTMKLKQLTGSGDIAGAGLFSFNIPLDNWWDYTGSSCAIRIIINDTNSRSTGRAITLDDKDIIFWGTGATGTLFDENVDLGAGNFLLYGQFGNAVAVMASGKSLACDEIMFGYSSGNDVSLDLATGAHTITSFIKAYSHASNTGTLTLDVATSEITLTSVFDGASQGSSSALTVVGEATNGGHCVIHGGTVQNVSMPLDDAALDCTDSTLGAGNVNVWGPGTPGIHAAFNNGIIGAGAAA